MEGCDSKRVMSLILASLEIDLKVFDLKVDLKSLRLVNLTDFGFCRYTLSGGECRTSGHFLKTQLEDHNLSNNNDILGQKTQNT